MKYQFGPKLETIYYLCELFDLPEPDQFSQSWAHEYTVPAERLNELLDGYEDGELTDEEKFGLMAFFLNSMDQAVKYHREPEGIWDRCSAFLKEDSGIHLWLIDYWSSWDNSEEEIEDAFALTPRMRKIFAELKLKRLTDPS